jgi:hypothetical protein
MRPFAGIVSARFRGGTGNVAARFLGATQPNHHVDFDQNRPAGNKGCDGLLFCNTGHVNSRTAHVVSRTGHANPRTARADSRTGHANPRTAHADSRTGKANPRTAYANSRTGHANPRTAYANSITGYPTSNSRYPESTGRRLNGTSRHGQFHYCARTAPAETMGLRLVEVIEIAPNPPTETSQLQCVSHTPLMLMTGQYAKCGGWLLPTASAFVQRAAAEKNWRSPRSNTLQIRAI